MGDSTIKTPAPGTRLYRCDWNTDEVETYVFVEESIAPGAYAPTWVLRKVGEPGRIRTSRSNAYRPTRRQAFLDMIGMHREAVKIHRRSIVESNTSIKAARGRIKAAKERLAAEKRPN